MLNKKNKEIKKTSQINLKKETIKKIATLKYQLGLSNYDETINYLLKNRKQ